MDEGQIEQAVIDRFGSQVEDVLSIATIYDNMAIDEDKPPSELEEYLEFSVNIGDSFQAERAGAVGTRKHIITGVAVAQFRYATGTGTKRGTDVGKVIRDAFRSQTVGGVTYKSPVIRHSGRDGSHFKTVVTIPFFAQDLG